MKELYSYNYPLKLSAQFLNYTNKTDCLLKTEILASLCTNSVKKQFYFFDFFQKIKLSNSKICTIKQKLLCLIQELELEGVIENKIVIVFKNGRQKEICLDKLISRQLSRGIYSLIFYENIFK